MLRLARLAIYFRVSDSILNNSIEAVYPEKTFNKTGERHQFF